MAKLVCRAGPNAGYEYPLEQDKTTFGRQSSCDVQVMDNMASREHFVIRRDGRLYTLVDAESRNGTKVNEQKVTERQLEFGDRIVVGEVEFVFVKEEGDVELRDLLTRKYEILGKIGEGGMGIVYKARQRSMDRIVALKVLAPKYAARPKFVQQFIDEARAAGRLNHANIIQVHDVDTENNVHYFSMEFIEGVTCRALLKQQGVFSQEEALEIGRLTAKALAYAHENHIIHRDVKPDNIMIGINQTVKLADLGISKTFEEAESEGKPKKVVGTPHYMAPEVALGHRIDHRIDIYSLGATLYHLLTNRTPFSGTTVNDVLKGHVKNRVVGIREINRAVHPEVEALIAKLMAKEPDQRHQSCQEVTDAILDLQQRGILKQEPAPSGDTVMLRRFAIGEAIAAAEADAAAGSGSSPGASTGGGARNRPPPRSGGRTRSRHTADVAPGASVMRKALSLIIFVLIAALGLILAQRFIENSDPSPGSAPTTDAAGGPATAVDDTPLASDDTDTDDTDEADALAQAEARRELRAIREGLGDAESADLTALRDRLDRLRTVIQDQAIRSEIEDVHTELLERQEKQQQIAALDQWKLRQRSIQDLRARHEYDLALEQLQSYAIGKRPSIKRQANELATIIEQDKAAFITMKRQALHTAIELRDADRLAKLKASLPLSMDDSQLAEDIARAQATLESELTAQREQVVDEARSALEQWQIEKVREIHRKQADELAGTEEGEQLEQITAHAATLATMITAVDEAVQAMDKKPRFDGNFYAYADPDLSGARLTGLVLTPKDGSTAIAPWDKIGREQLHRALTAALGENGLEPYTEALAATRSGE
ncbi:MAG: protein kinase domain-containing protein [Planctomycetota bacterium]